MTHLKEEQLVLYFYGESDETLLIAEHLAGCPVCREDLAGIQRTLNAVDSLQIPERDAAYGERVWRNLSPQIKPKFRFWPLWMQPHRLAACAALAAVVIVAYLAGRGTIPAQPKREVAAESEAARNRLLMANVSDHLERSQRILLELANGEPGSLTQDRARAEDLLATNRLYRISAQRDRQPALADLLDELEQVLTEVSNADPAELRQIQKAMAQQDLLFKIRVVDTQLRQKQRKPLNISSD